ncbi:MAG: LacI family DNA-binding transcriptional regulator [Anaerolineales bacterium]|nr:LacI family DNA-binding transcriptional regulator [Anaerolineales bacterium]
MKPRAVEKKKACTIADIAREAGVSKSTVSRALNDNPLIGDGTKQKINAIAKKRHFQINMPARRLTLKQSNTIAFVTHSMYKQFSVCDLFTMEILGGITSGLKEQGYDLLMLFVDPCDADWPAQHLAAGRADGFILMTSTRKQAHIKMLVEMDAPFIAWGIPHPKYSYCTVIGDDLTGGKLAAGHLAGLGRKRIAFLGGPSEEKEVSLRFEGYSTALQEAGLIVDPLRVVHGDYSDKSGAEKMRSLLDRAPDLDAVFVNSDLMAIGAMQVLREIGKRVPEDVAVVGYDNLSITEKVTPTLTTVSQNIPLVGKLLAQNLLQYIRTRAVTHTTVPVELVVRQSA